MQRSLAEPAQQLALATLSANQYYWQGEVARAQALAGRSDLATVADDTFLASYALGRLASIEQAAGASSAARQQLTEALERRGTPAAARAQLLRAQALLHLLAGDLQQVERTAWQLQQLSEQAQLRRSLSWAHYLRARVCYERNRLDDAVDLFRAVLATPDTADGLPLQDSHLGLALANELRGEHDAADEELRRLEAHCRERGLISLPAADSFRARLALHRGEVAAAAARLPAGTASYHPLSLENPFFTYIRVMTAVGTVASLQKAMAALAAGYRRAQTTHNTLRLVEALVLRALALQGQGKSDTALDVLQQSVAMAWRNARVLVFVEMGSSMANLLYPLAVRAETEPYALQLLAAFPRSAQARERDGDIEAQPELIAEPLTDRESEILSLLDQRLSNKEIAQTLIISQHTVKKHASNIYQKLGVHGRRQAVAQARQLGLLAPAL